MDNNEYHIYLHLDELASGSQVMAGESNKSSSGESQTGDSSLSAVENKLKKVVSLSTAVALADKIASYEISQVSLRTGAIEYEQRLSSAYSVARSIGGAGIALAGGFMTGGPAGAAVAAIGIAMSAVNKIISIAQKEQTLSTEQSLENISIGMAAVRAGVSGRRDNS